MTKQQKYLKNTACKLNRSVNYLIMMCEETDRAGDIFNITKREFPIYLN